MLPPSVAYGDEGWPPRVPPGATIEMDLELVAFSDAETLRAQAKAEEVGMMLGVMTICVCV